jgi:hypothetical protein
MNGRGQLYILVAFKAVVNWGIGHSRCSRTRSRRDLGSLARTRSWWISRWRWPLKVGAKPFPDAFLLRDAWPTRPSSSPPSPKKCKVAESKPPSVFPERSNRNSHTTLSSKYTTTHANQFNQTRASRRIHSIVTFIQFSPSENTNYTQTVDVHANLRSPTCDLKFSPPHGLQAFSDPEGHHHRAHHNTNPAAMSLRHRARPRKLNPKAVLQCFRFDQVNIDIEDDSARLAEIDNGVDKVCAPFLPSLICP